MTVEWSPEPGMQLQTSYGPATVTRVTMNSILIHLDSGPMQGQTIPIPPSLFDAMVKPIAMSPEGQKNSFASKSKSKLSDRERKPELFKKQQCINALRFGLVPHDFIDELTLGYGDLKRWIFSTFPRKSGNKPQAVHQIIGPFGEGKSHTMSVIRHIAYNEGYLVGRLEVDGRRVTLADPKSILYPLLNSLKAKDLDPIMPMLKVYLKVIEKGYRGPSISNSGIDRIGTMYSLIKQLRNYDYLQDVEHILYDVITCSDDITATEAKKIIIQETAARIHPWSIKIYPMIGQRVNERPDNFMECLVGTSILAILAGYKGLIITIDEYEVEETLLSGRESLTRAASLLCAMQNYFSGNTVFPSTPLAIYFASVPASDERSINGHLIESIVTISSGQTYSLEPYNGWDPENQEQLTLVKRVHDIYTEAFSCAPLAFESLVRSINEIMDDPSVYESGGIRNFMKRYIGLLDSLYGPPWAARNQL